MVKTGKLWDIFCRVIDNHGDIGVCWRLCTGLAERGERVRLWVDDATALSWMAPQGATGVEVRPWPLVQDLEDVTPGEILVEAFGCEIAPYFIAKYAERIKASGVKPLWINLEYLSAERFVERCHGLPSPVMHGAGAGLEKRFYYPGFTPTTGGLLREAGLAAAQARFDRSAWLTLQRVSFQGETLVSLFCYEPPALGLLLDRLASGPDPSRLLVTAGRASAAVQFQIQLKNRSQPLWNKAGLLSFSFLPYLTQVDFDHLLWACDLNLVRGEDSWIRAIWAGKPFVWQIYPQHDDAHHAKLSAFLELLSGPNTVNTWHRVWNGVNPPSPLPKLDLADWQPCFSRLRNAQIQQNDLVTRLLNFVAENH